MVDFPYLLVDREKCRHNIERVALKCKNSNIKLRPHFKTHQNIQVGELFRQSGIDAITVSSVQMAEFFAQNGWNDISLAFPVYSQIADKINKLAQKISLGVIFSSAKNLLSSMELIVSQVDVYIEVDVGNARSGVSPANNREIALMLNLIGQHKNMLFKGFITHAGQTYHAKSAMEVMAITRKSMCMLSGLKQFWKDSFPNLIVSYGDTPSVSVCTDFWAIDEIRAGNFVYYDLMQNHIGSCDTTDIAVALVAPIVDICHDRGEALIHAGAVHLSKEFIEADGQPPNYGLVCPFCAQTQSWGEPFAEIFVKSLSQEHGVVSFNQNLPAPFSVGDLVAILPVHSCLTANLMRSNTCITD